MRCLNCGTIVADCDPRCLSCGAQCTTPVKDQARKPLPIVGLILMFAGVIGYPLLHGPVPQKDVLDHKIIAYVWGLVGFFVGLGIDLFIWWRGQRQWPAEQPPAPASSWRPATLAPGALPSPFPDAEPPARGRSWFVRALFGVVWAVGLFFVAGFIASMLATQGVGEDPALRKQAAEHAGATVGPWLFLGSIAVAVVGSGLGLLPGTGRRKKA